MEQEKKIKWGTIGIIVAILILAASILFSAVKISKTINSNIQNIRSEIREKIKKEIKTELQREIVAFMYAYRSSSLENRQITSKDLKEGYQFAEKFLAGK